MPRYLDITEMSRYTTWLMRVHGTLCFFVSCSFVLLDYIKVDTKILCNQRAACIRDDIPTV
ncbi:hypothetical protein OIU77_008222 [Salix suchowensis]|uniref:Uncharacterized protein n=1 Tax=Salix suchowensis TaxID=1278906 RepID=A0ABQ9AIQ5_9ROSI|nr:hypothetical protein OIU77_008222 [Salix suchowensis]KAJ6373799.1 hypothetical protein OIU78_029476 [Salix suchowensis]